MIFKTNQYSTEISGPLLKILCMFENNQYFIKDFIKKFTINYVFNHFMLTIS
jgi:hypothetical protein